MSINGIQPLDLQTEPLDRGQYPSLRFLLVIAAIISSLLIVSWAAHRHDPALGARLAAEAASQDGRIARADVKVPRDVIARAIPLRP